MLGHRGRRRGRRAAAGIEGAAPGPQHEAAPAAGGPARRLPEPFADGTGFGGAHHHLDARRGGTGPGVDVRDRSVGPGHRFAQDAHRLHRLRVQRLDASRGLLAGAHDLGIQFADALAVSILGVDSLALDPLFQVADPPKELGFPLAPLGPAVGLPGRELGA